MKVCVLVCATAKGELLSLAALTSEPIMAAAKAVRDSGTFQDQKIVAGVVFHSERLNPIKEFKCGKPAPAAEKPPAEKPPAEKPPADADTSETEKPPKAKKAK